MRVMAFARAARSPLSSLVASSRVVDNMISDRSVLFTACTTDNEGDRTRLRGEAGAAAAAAGRRLAAAKRCQDRASLTLPVRRLDMHATRIRSELALLRRQTRQCPIVTHQ